MYVLPLLTVAEKMGSTAGVWSMHKISPFFQSTVYSSPLRGGEGEMDCLKKGTSYLVSAHEKHVVGHHAYARHVAH